MDTNMEKNIFIDLIINDIKEVEMIVSSLGSMPTIPPVVMQLAKANLKHIADNFDKIASLEGIEVEPLEVEQTVTIQQKPIKPIATVEKNVVLLDEEDDELPQPKITTEQTNTRTTSISEKFMTGERTIVQEQKIVSKTSSVDARIVTNLKKAIGINDRFRFKRDLFLGDEDKMMETIADLDKCGSLEEAKSYVKDNFVWKDDNETVIYLFDILRKRFS